MYLGGRFMDLKSLKVLFEDDSLKRAVAMRAPLQKGWLLHFERRAGGLAVMGTVRDPGSGKVFRSLDAAATAAADIGFAELQVKIIDKQTEGIDPDGFELKAQ